MNTETVNLKSAITFRVNIMGKAQAFTTRAFRGERRHRGNIPEKHDHVAYHVEEIALDSTTTPWLKLTETTVITVLWSNVLAVQYDTAAGA